MRKCYLCGAVIRRRAEFCRFCTARQPDAATPVHEGVPVGTGGAVPPPWLLPTPPASLASADRRGASFQPTWEFAAEARLDPPTEILVEAAVLRTDESPAVYDDPVLARRHREAPDHTVLNDKALADDNVLTDDNALTDDTVLTDDTANGHEAKTNGNGPTAKSGTNGTTVKSNGHGANGTNTSTGTNGRHTTARTNGTGTNRTGTHGARPNRAPAPTAVAPSTRPAERPAHVEPAPVLDPSDPLLGFEHFPDAEPAPEVRWG
jgi:hypothetical protein